MTHPDRTRWIDSFEAEVERLGCKLRTMEGGIRALRMDSADFFEVVICSPPLSARVYFHESVTDADAAQCARLAVEGRWLSGQAISDWHWDQRGVGTEREEEV